MTFQLKSLIMDSSQYIKTHFSPETTKPILGPSINGQVTDGNTKLCCRGSILALFQSTTADKDNKVDSEHTRDYTKLFPVCKVKILQVTVNTIEVLSSF